MTTTNKRPRHLAQALILAIIYVGVSHAATYSLDNKDESPIPCSHIICEAVAFKGAPMDITKATQAGFMDVLYESECGRLEIMFLGHKYDSGCAGVDLSNFTMSDGDGDTISGSFTFTADGLQLVDGTFTVELAR